MSEVGRREFIGTAAAAAGVTILKPSIVFGSQANSAVRLGLLGCGGRGTTVTSSFLENTGAVVTAIGDIFQDNLQKGKQQLDQVSAKMNKPAIDASRMFKGLQGVRGAVRLEGRRRPLHRHAALLPPGAPRGGPRLRQARLLREAGGR